MIGNHGGRLTPNAWIVKGTSNNKGYKKDHKNPEDIPEYCYAFIEACFVKDEISHKRRTDTHEYIKIQSFKGGFFRNDTGIKGVE